MAQIVVVGAGGMGGYFAGLLAESGNEVTLLARGATLAAVAERGVRIEEPGDSGRTVPVRVVADLADAPVADIVLVCVKSWQVAALAPTLAPVVGPGTVVIPIQNGVDAGDRLAAALGPEHAVGGSGFVIAMRTEPGSYLRLGRAPSVEIGALDDVMTPARLEDAAAILTTGGLACRVTPDIRRGLWRKLMFIASFGGVCALSGVTAEEIRTEPHCRDLVVRAMHEVADVARAGGINVTDADVARTVAQLDGLAPDATASMARDLGEGRPSELTDQNGAVVGYGERFGVVTPVHTVIYGALLPRELRARGA